LQVLLDHFFTTQLAGGSAQAAAAGAMNGTAGSSGLTVAALAPIVASVLASAVVVTAIHDTMQKNFDIDQAIKDREAEATKKGQRPGFGTSLYAPPVLPQTQTQKDYIAALTSEQIIKQQLLRDAKEQAVVSERQLKAGFSSGTLQIQQDQIKAEKDLLEKYAKDRTDIEKKGADDRDAVLADLATQQTQAEIDYITSRAQAIRDGNLEIQRIEQDSQKRLEQLAKEHTSRVTDLTASRDALGLAKEKADYSDKKQQEVDNTNTEIKRRREDIALKLKDLDQSYRREQQQRQAAANAKLQQIAKAEQTELQMLASKQATERMMQAEHYKILLKTLTDEFQKALVAIKTAAGAYGGENSLPKAKASGGPVTAGMPYLVGEQGPEIFNPRSNGNIIPAGPTAAMLNPRTQYGYGSSRSMNVRIESSTLTVTQIMSEMDKRFRDFERGLENTFAE